MVFIFCIFWSVIRISQTPLIRNLFVITMLRRGYNNFVRSTAPTEIKVSNKLCGEEAKKLYLEVVDQVLKQKEAPPGNSQGLNTPNVSLTKRKRKPDKLDVSNLKLFTSAQVNDVDSLKLILDACPEKLNTVDDYGWSLLMIACQAQSCEAVKELLKRGVDTSVRDKAGNSAQSLVIRNKNSHLADILLSYLLNCDQSKEQNVIVKEIKNKMRHKEKYLCEICDNRTFDSKEEHLSSTLHNINASKGRKIPTNYVIPQSNKGYQIMLKTGWDKETGLGPNGFGPKYPIKAVQKNDKKGLGLEKKRLKSSNEESTKQLKINEHLESANERNRRIEINFRRQFY